MFVRASRRKLNQRAQRQLHPCHYDLHLPWLCPALYQAAALFRTSAAAPKATQLRPTRSTLSGPVRSQKKIPGSLRGLASAAPFEQILPQDDHVPFEGSNSPSSSAGSLYQSWAEAVQLTTLQHFDPDSPLIINDSLTTTPPRFRSTDAITGELSDISPTMRACLQVGRFERATTLMRRLNQIFKPEAPDLLAAHNDYVRELSWKIVMSKDQQLLRDLQRWFEVDLRGRGVVPDATIYAAMIQAVLQDISPSKSDRSVRRYLHLAEEAGLRDQLMNVLLAMLNAQDLGRVTRITPLPFNPLLSQFNSIPSPAIVAQQPKGLEPNSLHIPPVDPNLPGLKALHKSLSIFSDTLAVPTLDSYEGTEQEKRRKLNIERQIRVEEDTYESAIERWRVENQDLKRLGINSALTMDTVGALMWDWHKSLAPAIEEEVRLANEAEAKSVKKPIDEARCQYGPFLQYLKPEKISAITILTCMMVLSSSKQQDMRIAHTVLKVGSAVQDESITELLKTSKAHPRELWRHLGRHLGSHLGRDRDVGKITHALRNRQRGRHASLENRDLTVQVLEGQQWSSLVKARIGAILISKLISCAKINVHRKHPDTGESFEELQPAFLHHYIYSGGKRVGMLSLNSALHEKLGKEPVGASVVKKHMPMLVEPRPWTGFRTGGFLTATEPFVRLKQTDEQGWRYASAATDNGDLSQVFAGLDVLSKTPWQINEPVFRVVLEVWNSGEPLGDIAPSNVEAKLPPEPSVDDTAARRRYLLELKQIGNRKAANRSLRCFQNFQLEIAQAYLKETFYFPHSVDFRGRAYPIPPFLNYMGADLCRGLLIFGKGKELGQVGLKWLKIHLANVFGYDKASFEDRAAFVDDRLDEIFDSANNALTGRRWWLKAEDPWQCLAACKELRDALNSPDPTRFVSKLAVHQDGTCNGLQHYAALGGDSIGAKQVNLEPGEKPSDIYTAVAELVKEAVAKDAKEGSALAQALDGKITRKVVKQTVMTNVYGVTFQGARLQVKRQLEDLYPDFPNKPPVQYNTAALYIVRKIFSALANMFNGAHDIQFWLGDCASRIATAITPEQIQRLEALVSGSLIETNLYERKPLKRRTDGSRNEDELKFKQSVIWTSPLKMPVVQPYREPFAELVSTNLQTVTLNDPKVSDPVDKRKQLQAFPPNFIHSLDATHMVLSALNCEKAGLTFAAVHDSFWTHASDVETMSRQLRDTFIMMHSEDIIGRLAAEFKVRYKGCMYMASVKAASAVGKRIKAWRQANHPPKDRKGPAKVAKMNELLRENQRLKLLASEDPQERKKGKEMLTAASIFGDKPQEEDLVPEAEVEDVVMGNMTPSRQMKFQANKQLEVGDVENIGTLDAVFSHDADQVNGEPSGEEAEHSETVVVEMKEKEEEMGWDMARRMKRRAQTRASRTVWVWLPLTFPPVPEKGSFDVSRIGNSKYFFS